MTLCECGCGQETTMYRGKPRRFVVGHSRRGKTKYEIPICKMCGELLTNDNWYQSCKTKPDYICKTCHQIKGKNWLNNNPDKYIEHYKHFNAIKGHVPMNENRECSLFLGVCVAEHVLSKVFKNVERMPTNNKGFDFICNHGKRIDVKSACLYTRSDVNMQWIFYTKKNVIADYFLCIAFDDRKELNPIYLWLIPAHIAADKNSISVTTKSVQKWDKYKLELDRVVECCDMIRGK